MSTDRIEYEVEEGAAVIRLNRPERMNALSEALVTELTDALERAEATADRISPQLADAAHGLGELLGRHRRPVRCGARAQRTVSVGETATRSAAVTSHDRRPVPWGSGDE